MTAPGLVKYNCRLKSKHFYYLTLSTSQSPVSLLNHGDSCSTGFGLGSRKTKYRFCRKLPMTIKPAKAFVSIAFMQDGAGKRATFQKLIHARLLI